MLVKSISNMLTFENLVVKYSICFVALSYSFLFCLKGRLTTIIFFPVIAHKVEVRAESIPPDIPMM